jgi:hypothetical protein
MRLWFGGNDSPSKAMGLPCGRASDLASWRWMLRCGGKGLLHCAKFCEASAIRVKTATGEIVWLDYPRILTGTLCQIPDSRTNSRIFLLVQIASCWLLVHPGLACAARLLSGGHNDCLDAGGIGRIWAHDFGSFRGYRVCESIKICFGKPCNSKFRSRSHKFR